jgi:purine-binding chemotaxis protein CheW
MKSSGTARNQTLSVIDDTSSEKYLTFFIDGQLYAVSTSRVAEIIRMQAITFLPGLPPYVKGVINLRGKIVPLIDMRLKFRKEEKEYGAQTSVVIVESGEMTVGLIADSVNDVTDVAKNQLSENPKYKSRAGNRYVCGIASLSCGSALVLDIAKVLDEHARGSAESSYAPPKQAAAQ